MALTVALKNRKALGTLLIKGLDAWASRTDTKADDRAVAHVKDALGLRGRL